MHHRVSIVTQCWALFLDVFSEIDSTFFPFFSYTRKLNRILISQPKFFKHSHADVFVGTRESIKYNHCNRIADLEGPKFVSTDENFAAHAEKVLLFLFLFFFFSNKIIRLFLSTYCICDISIILFPTFILKYKYIYIDSIYIYLYKRYYIVYYIVIYYIFVVVELELLVTRF